MTGLVSISVRLAAAVAAVLALGLLASCGSDEEQVAPVVTAAPTTPPPMATVPPTQSQSATQTPEPGWAVYTQPPSAKSESFSFSYPDSWFVEGGETDLPGSGLSIILKSWPKGQPPVGAVKVDIYVNPLDSAVCVFENAAPAKLGPLPAWEPPRLRPEDTELPSGTIRRIIADHGGFRYCLTAYFVEGADKSIFERIIGGFTVPDPQ